MIGDMSGLSQSLDQPGRRIAIVFNNQYTHGRGRFRLLRSHYHMMRPGQ
jgi:hypothetical protein